MKEKLKGILLGIIIGTLLVPTVFAAVNTVKKELSYNNIKITLNGQRITPTDANGKYVEPFIIDGTTYLPVRAVANVLGLNVEWDATNNTVALKDAINDAPQVKKVVYDKGGVKITYTGFEKDNSDSSFKFLVENNSSNNITIQARDESINGFMVSGIMSDDVQAGKKANIDLQFRNSKLKDNGITNIEDLEFSFHIFEQKSWDTIDDSKSIKIEL